MEQLSLESQTKQNEHADSEIKRALDAVFTLHQEQLRELREHNERLQKEKQDLEANFKKACELLDQYRKQLASQTKNTKEPEIEIVDVSDDSKDKRNPDSHPTSSPPPKIVPHDVDDKDEPNEGFQFTLYKKTLQDSKKKNNSKENKAKSKQLKQSELKDSEEYSVVDLADDSSSPSLSPIRPPPSRQQSSLARKRSREDKPLLLNKLNAVDSKSTPDNKNGIPNAKKPFKYVEVVRKKADRELLPGHECEECKKFLDALGDIGIDRKNFVNDCSRHKHTYSPPKTPPGFWEVSFPETETQE